MAELDSHTPPWWQRGVVYQIYPRSFKDASGDGVGDLKGVTEKLAYLQWLGVDAVWISPIYPSPARDFGYDVTDFEGVDPLFGTLDDFDEMVREAHRLGIKVILDFLPNHSSDEHPWFQASRGSREDAKRDWYTWRDAQPDGSPPNNWRSLNDLETPGSAWVWDDGTQQYYLATFSPFQPELNWRNPEVRAAMLEVMRFWLERGVDGFRLDMLDFLGKDALLRDEPPETAAASDYPTAAKYHLNQPETHAYIREMRRVLENYPDRVLVGEVLYYLEPEQFAPYYGDDEAGKGLDLPFNFGLMFTPLEARALRAKVDAYDAALGENWPNYNLSNHDMPRLSRHGEAARLVAALLLTLRGTPFLYYGEELDMANVEVPPEKQQDSFVVYQTGLTRDAVRTPMQWDASTNAGFSEAEPWLPVAKDYEVVNVAHEKQDETSVLWLYKRLLALRRTVPALAVGDYEALSEVPDACFAYRRETKSSKALVLLNFSAEACDLELPGGPWQVALSTRLDREGDADSRFHLRSFEGVVLTPGG